MNRANLSILKKEKGSILLFAILVSTIVLTVGLAISEVIISEIKIGSDISNSQIAYNASVSGVETGLNALKIDINTRIPQSAPLSSVITNGATSAYSIYDQSGYIIVEGIGLSGNVRRKVTAKITNQTIGYAVGFNGVVYKYSDASGWQKDISFPVITTHLSGVAIADTSNIWIVGGDFAGNCTDPAIYHFNGSSWSSNLFSGSSNTCPYKVSAISGQAFTNRNTASMSRDVAEYSATAYINSWTVYGQTFWPGGKGISALAPNEVYTKNTRGDLYKFNGASWSLLATPSSKISDVSGSGIYALNSTNIWEVGLGKTYKYDGVSLSQKGDVGMPDLFDVYFADENNGWVSGNMGVYKTINGGANWSLAYAFSGWVDDIDGIDKNNVWAVGGNKVIYYNGTSWLQQNISSNSLLYGIDMYKAPASLSNVTWEVVE